MALCALLLLGSCAPSLPGWELVFADEFDGDRGEAPDPRWWTAATGGGGWGNEELQDYDARNAEQDGDGHLVITADRATGGTCWYGSCAYSSARLHTSGKFSRLHGRFEARVRVPQGRGLWSAFWMLGEGDAWPYAGEIDVMEHLGSEPDVVHGTLHGPGYSGPQGPTASTRSPGATQDFRTYAVEWEPGSVTWLVDGRATATFTPATLPAGARWVFDRPHHLLLNLAVGGRWPGPPDGTTPFPSRLVVDHVRVYERAG
ncbi:family 16 glycosylhydrolase [Lentzea sp. NPDC058436]|uniref:glycoside hydrolase family 16 protein n=1 Tax=Lentzea sp. NPDC058436 TaxID=3346499 RepID=UPI003648F903